VDDTRPEIDWSSIKIDDIGRLMTVIAGVQMKHFEVLLTYTQLQKVDAPVIGINVNPDYKDRDNSFRLPAETDAKIRIPDDELSVIMLETGVPFLDIRELEYGKREIIDLCIYPAVQEYFKYFPIIKEDVYGSVGQGSDFKIRFPEMAYHAVPYYTMGSSPNGGGIGAGGTAFAFMSEQFMSGSSYGQSGGRFGRGIAYYGKPVPGWTGMQNDTRIARLRQMEAAQGFTNYFRRERYKKIKEVDGNYYATGFSTVGGVLNVKWLCWSRDWDDIEFNRLQEVRDICTARILQSLGMLRNLISVEVAKIDFTSYTSRAKELRDPVIEFWKGSAGNMALAVERGGG
jgi:hypothetical protein